MIIKKANDIMQEVYDYFERGQDTTILPNSKWVSVEDLKIWLNSHASIASTVCENMDWTKAKIKDCELNKYNFKLLLKELD
jgi:hypothetical protein